MENVAINHTKADEISPLTLAFVGDGVYDLLVRENLVKFANRPVGELNKIKVKLVNCTSQSDLSKQIFDSLTEKEKSVFKRGRNAAPKCTAKHGTVADYHNATGLEALFGYLWLNQEFERTNEIFQLIIHKYYEHGSDNNESEKNI